MSSARRLTGTVGRWSASHPWTAIAAWLGAVAVLLVAGHLAGTIQLPNGAQNVGPSGQAEQMISRDFPRHAVEPVLFDSPTLRVSDPAYQAAIRDVLSRIQATGRVTQVQSPLDPGFANQISATRHAALLQFRLTGSVGDSATRVVPVLAAVRAVRRSTRRSRSRKPATPASARRSTTPCCATCTGRNCCPSRSRWWCC
jgi:uncharacterized membrane protein YdfJ with MMPL/SSD domain